MEFNEFLETLKKKLFSNYDLYDDFELKGQSFNLFARYFMRSERYVASKRFVIYGMETNDYLLVKRQDSFTAEDLDFYMDWVKKNVESIVKPHEEHMVSTLTLTFILDQMPSPELIKKIERSSFYKSFSWGFKGWVDLRLAIYSLDEKKFVSNKKGREVRELFIY